MLSAVPSAHSHSRPINAPHINHKISATFELQTIHSNLHQPKTQQTHTSSSMNPTSSPYHSFSRPQHQTISQNKHVLTLPTSHRIASARPTPSMPRCMSHRSALIPNTNTRPSGTAPHQTLHVDIHPNSDASLIAAWRTTQAGRRAPSG